MRVMNWLKFFAMLMLWNPVLSYLTPPMSLEEIAFQNVAMIQKIIRKDTVSNYILEKNTMTDVVNMTTNFIYDVRESLLSDGYKDQVVQKIISGDDAFLTFTGEEKSHLIFHAISKKDTMLLYSDVFMNYNMTNMASIIADIFVLDFTNHTDIVGRAYNKYHNVSNMKTVASRKLLMKWWQWVLVGAAAVAAVAAIVVTAGAAGLLEGGAIAGGLAAEEGGAIAGGLAAEEGGAIAGGMVGGEIESVDSVINDWYDTPTGSIPKK